MLMPVEILAFIQRIINRSWKTTGDMASLARWIRCLFQIALSSDEKISLLCVDQAIGIAEKRRNVSKQIPSLRHILIASLDCYPFSNHRD
jgi:hypothetical protein